jgi:cytosine/uracil/thiamine/allantoin permease
MTSRQAGHFFFEPKGYDEVNQATHEYKEEVKVGYNLFRKIVFMTIWALTPLLLLLDPTLLGIFAPHNGPVDFLNHLGLLWLALAGAGLLFRTIQLFFVRDPVVGIAWAVKIVTDPLHDILLYHKAPLRLLKGERFAPAP